MAIGIVVNKWIDLVLCCDALLIAGSIEFATLISPSRFLHCLHDGKEYTRSHGGRRY